MTVYELNLNGKEQLKSMYSVYVIILNNEADTYFYVGQTGDRKHISARSPFYRLTGHLDKQESSTQNQVYKGIVEKILKIKYDENTHENVEKYLSNLKLKMYTFPIFDFQYNISKEEHSKKRKHVEDIEKILLEEFVKKFGKDRIINKIIGFRNIPSKKFFQEIEDIMKFIFQKEVT